MSLSEFAIINKYFSTCGNMRPDCLLGIGDDAALLRIADRDLVVTQDTLVAGVHFFHNAEPYGLGHKCLAVNLSDLAAMGAEPAWCTLAITLPTADPNWLDAFARGFCQLATSYGVQLIGGDTTKGPLMISVTALGLTPKWQALRRSGATPHDHIYVSGNLGDAGLALYLLSENYTINDDIRQRLDMPTPRIALGLALRQIASAAIDISDGIAADLDHILQASGNLGADVYLNQIPNSAAFARHVTLEDQKLSFMNSGDDYELCFTVPESRTVTITEISAKLHLKLTHIGNISSEPGLRIHNKDGKLLSLHKNGYQHFT
ncbi:hypothetical protein TI04_04560 [Achromatium sp. WMS2]|nr:hypothetical protein TI04_04560 [Achromatium sp. WMS2]